MCQRPALHFVTSEEARSGTISTSDANDPMGIISMLFLFVKQSAFICRTFIEDDQRVRSLPGDIVPLFRPQGAGDDILTKYNVAHWSGQSEKIKLSGCMKRKDPPFRAGLFFSWNPATSYSPR